MEQTNNKTGLQEQQTVTEPTAAPAPRPWVTPTLERVPLKEALFGGAAGNVDGMYTRS
jgi:hypothetical protein